MIPKGATKAFLTTVRRSRSGGPGHLERSGHAPCFAQAEKRELPKRRPTRAFRFRTRVALVLQGVSHSNRLSSELRLRQDRRLPWHRRSIIHHFPCRHLSCRSLPRSAYMLASTPYDQSSMSSQEEFPFSSCAARKPRAISAGRSMNYPARFHEISMREASGEGSDSSSRSAIS
jgi:hypothetical protein